MLLKKVPIIRSWSLVKISKVSDLFKLHSFEPGEIIYNIEDSVDRIYFVNEGHVQLQLFFLISQTQTAPISKNQVCRTTSNIVVKKNLSRLGHGRQFGYAEILLKQKTRLFRASVYGQEPVQVISISKKKWLAELSDQDIKDYLKLSKAFTDI